MYITNFDNAEVDEECSDWINDQEQQFLQDLAAVLDERFKNRLNRVYEHALEIRSHSLLVDRFVTTYNSKKSFFGNNKQLEKVGYLFPLTRV